MILALSHFRPSINTDDFRKPHNAIEHPQFPDSLRKSDMSSHWDRTIRTAGLVSISIIDELPRAHFAGGSMSAIGTHNRRPYARPPVLPLHELGHSHSTVELRERARPLRRL